MAIHFFEEDIKYKLKEKNKFKGWIKGIALGEGYKIGELNYIFCSDEYLYNINVEYLDHDTYTDIITFDNSEEEDLVEGDIFVSIERIQDNASTNNLPFETELKRVISHGLLHLLGYKDKTPEEKSIMRSKENEAMNSFPS
jgi:probable rRNA maturation factor